MHEWGGWRLHAATRLNVNVMFLVAGATASSITTDNSAGIYEGSEPASSLSRAAEGFDGDTLVAGILIFVHPTLAPLVIVVLALLAGHVPTFRHDVSSLYKEENSDWRSVFK